LNPPQASSIVIATPHRRHDAMVAELEARLPGVRVVRIRDRRELTLETLEACAPDFVFFPHWSWLIPEAIHARFRCVIFHMTDLPYGRGGSPLQNLIVRGHRETVMSALACVAEMDAGPIYLKKPLALEGTAETILRRAAALTTEMIVEILERRPTPVPQAGPVVAFQRRRPEDGDLAPLDDLGKVYDMIRMLDAEGYPAAFLQAGSLRLEFTDARAGADEVEARVRIRRASDA
jgi:methionyl-tRNA formyltransferase